MKNQNEQHLIGHLEEMRARIIRTLIAFLVSMAAAFIYVRDIYQWLVRDMDQMLVVLGPSDVMWVYFMIARRGRYRGNTAGCCLSNMEICSTRSSGTGSKSDFALHTKHHFFVFDWHIFWLFYFVSDGSSFHE